LSQHFVGGRDDLLDEHKDVAVTGPELLRDLALTRVDHTVQRKGGDSEIIEKGDRSEKDFGHQVERRNEVRDRRRELRLLRSRNSLVEREPTQQMKQIGRDEQQMRVAVALALRREPRRHPRSQALIEIVVLASHVPNSVALQLSRSNDTAPGGNASRHGHRSESYSIQKSGAGPIILGKIAVSLVGWLLLSSCSVYDGNLLDRLQPPPSAGKGGEAGRAGAAGRAQAGTGGNSTAGGDASVPRDAGPRDAGPPPDGEDARSLDAATDADTNAGTGGNGGTGGGGSGGSDAPCVPSASVDCCPQDANKTAPGTCGCGVVDVDSDLDGTADCQDDAPHGWRRRLTFDRTQVSGALTNFPLLVRLTDAHLGTSAAVSGNDIHFVAGDASTPLAYEIDSYDTSTGTLTAWVRIPALDTASDLVVYLGYGDGQSSRSNPSSLWSDHHYVWHLSQDPSTSGAGGIRDSAERAHGTAQGAMTTASSVPGVIGKAIAFDGVDDRISFTNDITGSGVSTMEAWVHQSAQTSGLGSAILTIGNQATNAARFFFSLETASGKSKVGFYSNDEIAVTLATAAWTHFAWVWDGSNTRIYVNGAMAYGPASHTSANTAGTAGNIGNSTFTSPAYNFYMLGRLDEIRVSTAVRSAAWIATEFNNQKQGSTFMKAIDAPMAAPAH
jgi:hypothetical protein